MSYLQLAYFHLAAVVPAFLIGAYLFLARKGTSRHRAWGKVYLVLMLLVAISGLLMQAQVGPTWLGHFGFIHLFSVLVLFSVPSAYFAAKRGDLAVHKRNMLGVYFGGLVIAGGFAFVPGRLLHTWLFA